MAGAGLPLEVVGDIMRFVGAPPPVTLTFAPRWDKVKCITAHPAHYIVEYKTRSTDRSKDVREVWPRSDETAALAKAMVRAWLASEGSFMLTRLLTIREKNTPCPSCTRLILGSTKQVSFQSPDLYYPRYGRSNWGGGGGVGGGLRSLRTSESLRRRQPRERGDKDRSYARRLPTSTTQVDDGSAQRFRGLQLLQRRKCRS
jgi:hypothetical protein